VDITSGIDSLCMGDLLFFGTKTESSRKVTHVGMYLGDTEFIHESGMVMKGSLDSSRINYDDIRKKSLLLARRIIGAYENAGWVTVSAHPWY
jgi:cell wall-associated NlpC family hydrolase